MKVTKENAIASVLQSVSSIFTKEDVLDLLNMIEDTRSITVTEINTAIENVLENFERNVDSVVDKGSADFTVGCDNRIELESLDLNLEYIRESLENNFMDFGEADDVVELERE